MLNPLRNNILETCDVTWLRRMYYERLNAEVIGVDPLVVIEANNPRDEMGSSVSRLRKL